MQTRLWVVALLLAGCGAEPEVEKPPPFEGEAVTIDDELGCPYTEFDEEPWIPSGTFDGEHFSSATVRDDGVFFGSEATYWTPEGGPRAIAPEEESWTMIGDWMVSLNDWSYRRLEPDGSTTPVGTLPVQRSIIGALDPERGRFYALGGADEAHVYRVDLATGTVAWSVPMGLPNLVPAVGGKQLFSIANEKSIVVFDAETGATTYEELPQPRIYHWLIAADGEWRLLMTQSYEVPGEVIEWWHPASQTSIPVATGDDIHLCHYCQDAYSADALWHAGTIQLVQLGLLFQIEADGRCSFRGSGSLVRASRQQAGKTTVEAYWYDGSGVWRL